VKTRVSVLLIVALIVSSSAFALAAERNETLIVGGGPWSPATSWNPLYPSRTSATIGLVYETLFAYNPLTNEHKPWLADSGEWISDTVYEVNLRNGIHWSDGEPLTAVDVVFTYEIARDNELPYTPIWRTLEEVKALSLTKVQFVFNNPSYQEWQIELYSRPIIPKHIWKDIPSDQLMIIANENPVGSGPYKSGVGGADRIVWDRDDNWWGNEVFGQPKPKQIVEMIIYENNVALGMLMQRTLDLSNYFIPGVPSIKDAFGLTTWYDEAPFMLQANTAVLYLNTQRAPLDDAEFRRALAFAVNPEVIVERVFEYMVPTADPTGLFGGWTDYRDAEVVEEYGFYYDPEVAKQMLDEAGYVDADGDGWRDLPDGSAMSFEIIVPAGWTDWMESIRIISEHFRAIGINATPAFPDQSVYENRMFTGNFDMLINNYGSGVSGSPFSYWNWIANHNIHRDQVTEGNFGRYDNQELFDLIFEFNQILPMTEESLAVASEIQKILLQEMPAIPFWLNGMWAQTTSKYWTNWPTENNPVGYPSTWGGYWQFGTIEMLINLEPVQ
jgi:peptide/nickel transport system substrate-binding protein